MSGSIYIGCYTEALHRVGLRQYKPNRCGAVVLIQLRGTPRPECRISLRYNPHTFFVSNRKTLRRGLDASINQ